LTCSCAECSCSEVVRFEQDTAVYVPKAACCSCMRHPGSIKPVKAQLRPLGSWCIRQALPPTG
jgi:hypothetical protein